MRGPFGALLGRLRALRGHPGARLGCLGGLGLSWGPRGALLGSLGGLLWPSRGFPGSVLGPSGVRLGPSWGSLGPSWGPLGPSGGSLGCLWGSVGAVLEAHPAVLDALPTQNASLAKMYVFPKEWGDFCLVGVLSKASGGGLGASGAVLEPSAGRAASIWGSLGPSAARSGPLRRLRGGPEGRPGRPGAPEGPLGAARRGPVRCHRKPFPLTVNAAL